MGFDVAIEGAPESSPRWLLCPGRAMVTVLAVWKPAGTEVGDRAPSCRLSYLTAPGSHPGALPPEIVLTDDGSGWRGKVQVQAPPFFPLRVRVELQPAFGPPRVAVLHVIPRSSAWVAAGLVVASLCGAALLLTMTLATLRITLTQAATGLSSVALLAVAGQVLRRALATLRPGGLPFFGVVHLVHRSAVACGLGLLALFVVLQSCVVVVHNDTPDEIKFAFPWRGSVDLVGPHARISVVPPEREPLMTNPLAFLDESERGRALCMVDPEGRARRDDRCRDDEDDAAVRGSTRAGPGAWFTPPTIVLRCGRRWRGLDPGHVLRDSRRGVRVEPDGVWLDPPPESECGRAQQGSLWYELDGAAHRVRHPWQPGDLEGQGELSIDGGGEGRPGAEVTLVSVGPEGAPVQETRIVLSGRSGSESVFPLASLVTGSELALDLEIGERLPEPTDIFSVAGKLRCERLQGRGTAFHATHLGLVGGVGWLTKLAARSPQGLAWSSVWTLAQPLSAHVATPWICEAIPEQGTQIVKRDEFASETLKLSVDPGISRQRGQQAVLVPAYLMSRDIEVHRHGAETTAAAGLLGRVSCHVDVGENALIAVGRVHLEDRRGGKIRSLRVAWDRGRSEWRSEGSPSPAATDASEGSEAWMCWSVDVDHRGEKRVSVTPLGANEPDAPIEGTWDVEGGTLRLQGVAARVCHFNLMTGKFTPPPAPGAAKLLRLRPAKELRDKLKGARRCDAIQEYDPEVGHD